MIKKFVPEKLEVSPFGHIAFKVTPELHAKYKRLAKAHGVSMIEFIRQAVEFAVANMDEPIVKMPRKVKGDTRTMHSAVKRSQEGK